MKICDLTQFYSPVGGGVKRYLQEKRSHILEKTDDSHLLITPGARDGCERQGRATHYTIASPLISKSSQYRALLRLGALQEILEREKPDLLESADPYQLGWKALGVAGQLRIPAVAFYHSHFPELFRKGASKHFGERAGDWALKGAQAYVCNLYNRYACTLVPSAGLGVLLEAWGVGNVINVKLGVDTAVFRSAGNAKETRAGLGIPLEKRLLLYVGRLAPEKNTELLCETFKLLPEEYHLLVVGDGQQRHLVEQLTTATRRVSWIPYCEDSGRLARIYRAADLFVHPGIQETFGLVALESQACGTPVVGIRGSYMDSVILSENSRWAAQATSENLAVAVQETEFLGEKQSEQLSRRAHQEYAWERVLEEQRGIYGKIRGS